MKKIIFLISLSLAVIVGACYDDYKLDYAHTAVYFSYQYPARTLILDPDAESFELKVGTSYGGKYSYKGAREFVKFTIDESLITDNQEIVDMGIKVMPSSWYALSNDSEIEMKDSNVGFVKVSIIVDSLSSHPEATTNTYAIPFKITEASTDSILDGKDFSIVVVKFKNEFDGRYYVKGVDNRLNSDGTNADTLVYSNDALVLNKYVFLNSISRDEVSVARIGRNENANNYVYQMKIRSSDGKAILSAHPSSQITTLIGAAQYNYSQKSFVCKYNYEFEGTEYSVCDTLIFSNTEINQESWK